MKAKQILPWVATAVLLFAFAGVVLAFAAGNVDGIWGFVDNGGDGSAYCDNWATGPAGGSTNYDNPTAISRTDPNIQGALGGTDWNQVRYGDPVTEPAYCEVRTPPSGSDPADCSSTLSTLFAYQSGFGFDGTNDVIEPPSPYTGIPFYLGKFCHFNNRIESYGNTFGFSDLTIQVADLACPAGYTIDKTSLSLSYRFTLDETPNWDGYPSGSCPYGDGYPCGDEVTISQNAGSPDDLKFRCTDENNPNIYEDFTITVLGFIPEALGGACPGTYNSDWLASAYFSDECNDNCACLWAEVSSWTPTAVELVSFEATSRKDVITLGWEMASEVDLLGFNLYRAESAGAPKTQLNADLIAAQGSLVGASYQYLDESVTDDVGYFYWLELVDGRGSKTLLGPVEATVPSAGEYEIFLPLVMRQ